MGPYAYKGDQWVGFDDPDMIRFKSKWIKEQGFGGGMIWALDLDDFTNRCGCEPYPLLKIINRELGNIATKDPHCKLGPGTSGREEALTANPTPTTMPAIEAGETNVIGWFIF